MTQHWTDEQMTAWTLGERRLEMAEHLAACEACRRELAEVQAALEAYRGGVEEALAGDEYRWVRICAGVAGQAVHHGHGVRWALTTGLALLALSVGLLVTPWHRPPKFLPVAQQPMSDEQLLNEIHDDLSRSAPEALAPAQTLQQERAAVLAQTQSQQSQSNRREDR